jgi:hypothetical protein
MYPRFIIQAALEAVVFGLQLVTTIAWLLVGAHWLELLQGRL